MASTRATLFLGLAICILAGNMNVVTTEDVTICSEEDLHISCPEDEVIIMTSAEFGRKEVSRCIPEPDEFMGCTNPALGQLDNWCSGLQSCDIISPDDKLAPINKNCRAILKTYMEFSYDCIKVQSSCRSGSTNVLKQREGFITSHVTNTAGCGSSRSPWVISANPGQTINITMFDFAVSSDVNKVTCRNIHGYILERALGINHTICGGGDRHVALYTSKTNKMEIHIATSERSSGDKRFLLHYRALGCQDLSRPPYAWYKREGNEALIGCETNDQHWRLTCTGNTWHGTVGNCSEAPATTEAPAVKDSARRLPSLVLLTGIGAAALVVIVVVIVTGVICISKQRIREETKSMQLTYYPTMDKHSQAYYRPVSTGQPTAFGKVPDNMSGSWEMTFPPRADTTTSYPAPCACSTLPYRPDANHARSMSAASSDGTTYETPKFVDSVPLTNC